MIGRRELIALLGGAAAVWPLAAKAQRGGKLPIIGYLGSGTPASQGQLTAVLVERLRQLGWIQDRNIAFEYRWAEGRVERFAEIASEFVRLKVDVIVTTATAPVIAAKQATSDIPIVFATSADPVGSGLVTSLARPGGNITGLSLQATDLASKRLELLQEVVPALRRLAIMANVGSRAVALEMRGVPTTAQTIGLDIETFEIRRAEDIAVVFDRIKDRTDALYVCSDPLVVANRTRINAMALAERVPTMHGYRDHVEAGGLMSYGPKSSRLVAACRRVQSTRFLRGAKPADLPVEQPIKFDLVINLKTAKALGLEVAPMLLARADEVIE